MRPVGVVTSGSRVSLAPALIFKHAEESALEEALVVIDDEAAGKRYLGVLRWLNKQDPLLKHTQRSAVVDRPELAGSGAHIPFEYAYVRIIGELTDGRVAPPRTPPTPRSVIKLIESPADVSLALDTESGLVIGRHKHSGVEIPMSAWSLPYHVGVVGATGTGKSRLVKALIDEIRAKTGYSVIVFDHSGMDYTRYWPGNVVSSSEIVLDPAMAASLIVDRARLGSSGNNYDYVLTAIYAYAAAAEGGGGGKGRRGGLLEYAGAGGHGSADATKIVCSDEVLRELEEEDLGDPEEMMRSVPWDINSFVECLITVAKKFKARESTIIKMRLLMKTYGKPIIEGLKRRRITSAEVIERARRDGIVVVDLSGEEQDVKRHVVAAVIDRLWARIEESREPQNIVLVVDEAHNYACQQGCRPSSNSIERVAREGRKWGIGLVLASQRMIDIATDVRGNVNTYFFSRLQTPGDFQSLEGVIDLGGLRESSLSLLESREFFFAGLGNPLKYPLLIEVREVEDPGEP